MKKQTDIAASIQNEKRLFVCAYVHMCICIYAYTFVYLCAHAFVCLYSCACLSACEFVCLVWYLHVLGEVPWCVSACVYKLFISVCLWSCFSASVFVCLLRGLCLCVYLCVHVCDAFMCVSVVQVLGSVYVCYCMCSVYSSCTCVHGLAFISISLSLELGF